MTRENKDTPLRPLRVLIVDDEGIMCQALRLIVTEMGFKVVAEAHSGTEVMPLVKKWSPDLVLLDINLPGVDGLELLRVLHTEQPDIKVVMISGDSTLDKVNKAIENGAADFIAKPFSPVAVIEKLKRFG